MVLAAQRSGSVRAASSGPATLPKPRQADKYLVYLPFGLGPGILAGHIIYYTRADIAVLLNTLSHVDRHWI